MNTFSLIGANNYTIKEYPTYASVTWEFVSSSTGIGITYPTDLDGAITINRAIRNSSEVNLDTGIIENVLHKSITHNFYTQPVFFLSQSRTTTSSFISELDNLYVISIGQNFYGEQIKPGSFELQVNSITPKIQDDSYGNLIISSSGIGYHVGNIFYSRGIAVIAENTSSIIAAATSTGIKIVDGTTVSLDYQSNLTTQRHQINVQLNPNEFTLSPFNPSILKTYTSTTGSVTQSFDEKNIPRTGSNSWKISSLMVSEVIKPYVTTIGLYNDRYELLAVAKLTQPIKRTFNTEQIFIVRFDIE